MAVLLSAVDKLPTVVDIRYDNPSGRLDGLFVENP